MHPRRMRVAPVQDAIAEIREERALYRSVEGALLGQGCDEHIAARLIAEVAREPRMKKSGQMFSPLFSLENALSRVVHFDASFPGARRVIAFIGPSQAGKTTLLAKLAARLHGGCGVSVGIVSAGSSSINPDFHLKTFASLMQIKTSRVEGKGITVPGLQMAIGELATEEVILIDLPSVEASETRRLETLGRILARFPDVEPILVIPASRSGEELLSITEGFERCLYNRAAFTKVDETGYFGPALSALLKMGKSAAFISEGPQVPDDVDQASPEKFAELLSRRVH